MKKSIIVVALVSVFSYGSSSEMCSLFVNKATEHFEDVSNSMIYGGSIDDICFSYEQSKKYMIKALSRCSTDIKKDIIVILESEEIKNIDRMCK